MLRIFKEYKAKRAEIKAFKKLVKTDAYWEQWYKDWERNYPEDAHELEKWSREVDEEIENILNT